MFKRFLDLKKYSGWVEYNTILIDFVRFTKINHLDYDVLKKHKTGELHQQLTERTIQNKTQCTGITRYLFTT